MLQWFERLVDHVRDEVMQAGGRGSTVRLICLVSVIERAVSERAVGWFWLVAKVDNSDR